MNYDSTLIGLSITAIFDSYPLKSTIGAVLTKYRFKRKFKIGMRTESYSSERYFKGDKVK